MSADFSNVCSKCSAPLSSDVPGKLCLKCLLGLGLVSALFDSEELPYSPPLTSDAFGNYRLVEKIGEGGCGVVYRAKQLTPIKRTVALKVIKLGMDTQAVIARFETERQALALMDHPNVAKVFDAGSSSNGRPFFVMELVAGKRITDYCDEHRLSIAQRLELFESVCLAIQHAHQKGIIHRDIKPANIIVAEQAGTPCPKVIDFGVARATSRERLADESNYTAFDQFVGTPAYMSPEQTGFLSDAVDTRTDIYALGVLLYELLTGRLPFELERLRGASLDEVCRIIRSEEPPKPSSVMAVLAANEMSNLGGPNANAPAKLSGLRKTELDSIILKALEKNPERRYATAEALAKDVRRFLAGEPVLAQSKQQPAPELPFFDSATFGVDGKVVLGTKDNAAQLWEANTGLKLTALDSTGDKWVKAKFSPDGKKILSVVDNNAVRIWDAASGKPLTDLLIHESQIMAAQFSLDGSMVATASFDKTARVWDSESLLPITDTFDNFDWVRSVDISPDGRRIAAVSGCECQIWDIAPKGMNFPSWLLRLSEALAGQNISEQGVLTSTSMDRALEVKKIRTELENSPAKDDWTVWGRWLLADPAKRAVSPFAGNLADRSARQ